MEGIDYIAAATLASIDVAESASLQAADGQRRSTHAKQPVEAPPAKDLATVARDAVKELSIADKYGRMLYSWLATIDNLEEGKKPPKPPGFDSRELSASLAERRQAAYDAAIAMEHWTKLHVQWLIANDARKKKWRAEQMPRRMRCSSCEVVCARMFVCISVVSAAARVSERPRAAMHAVHRAAWLIVFESLRARGPRVTSCVHVKKRSHRAG